jgi:hypothetical protein
MAKGRTILVPRGAVSGMVLLKTGGGLVFLRLGGERSPYGETRTKFDRNGYGTPSKGPA